MLLHWRRRGEGPRLPHGECKETTSYAGPPLASGIRHNRLSLHRRPFPRLMQSEPVVQHNHGITPNMQCDGPMPVAGLCDNHTYGKHLFVSRLLPPVLFRKRQQTKSGSGVQRHISGPQSRSVPALYFPSFEKETVNIITPQRAAVRAPGGCRGPCKGHIEGPGGRADPQSICETFQEADTSKNVERLSATGTVPAAAPSGKQGSQMEGICVVGTATRGAGRNVYKVQEMQGSEDAAGAYGIREASCQKSAQWHPPIARRYLNAAAVGRFAMHPQNNTKASPPVDRQARGSMLTETAGIGLEPGLPSTSSSRIDSSIRMCAYPDAPAIGSATMTCTTNSAATLTPSCGRQVGHQKASRPQSKSSYSTLTAVTEKVSPSASAKAPVEKNTDTKEVTNSLSVADKVAQATHCFPHAATKSTPQKMQAEKKPMSSVNEAIVQGSSKLAPHCSSATDQAHVKLERTLVTCATTRAKSPHPIAGIQQRISTSVCTSTQNKSRRTVPEEAYGTPLSPGKTKATQQVGAQATPPEGNSGATAGWRSVPHASLGKGKLRTLWSVESLSDALVVRRGLATVLLIDGIGSAALLCRVLSKKPVDAPQQQELQRDNMLTTVSTDDEANKLLNEVPAKVRSRSVILKILQGTVSLQQVLPVDVTQAQADLRLLSLPQLLILRLRNYHDFELSSQYHSCHASFLRTLDCRIAELLGAFLVNKAYFDLFTPLVEQHKLQLLSVNQKTSDVSFSPARAQQSSAVEERKHSAGAPSKPSFSAASTRCSSPQVTRDPAIGREEAEVGRMPAEEQSKAADERQNGKVSSHEQPPPCNSLHLNRADVAVGKEKGTSETAAEGKKLRWGHLTRAIDAQRRNGAEIARMCFFAPSETVKTTAGSDMDKNLSALQEEEKPDVATKGRRKPPFNVFSRETAAAGIRRHTRGNIERKPESGTCASEKQVMRPELQQQQGNAAAASKSTVRTHEIVVVEKTVGKQECRGSVKTLAEKSNASLIGEQARFLVESAAARGLLSLYSPSSFGIPPGEASAARPQLRALGAAFVRQLGLIVSAAGKGGVSSNSSKNNNVSAADVAVLQRLQKYVLEEKIEQHQGETMMELTRTAPQDRSRIDKKHFQEKSFTANNGIESMVSDNLSSPVGPLTGFGFARPAGVWVRLLVPWKASAAKRIFQNTKDTASYSPIVTSPSTATSALDCSYISPQAHRARQEVYLTVEKPTVETTATPNAMAGAGPSSPNTHSALAATTAKTNLMAAIAAARVRKANASSQAETAVATRQCEEESSAQWMEAFLWLRLPSPRDISKGGTEEKEAVADQKSNQKVATLQRSQQGRLQEGAPIAGKNTLNRGVFEIIVSNDRPVGEMLLWGLAPQNNKLLCKDSGLGGSSGISPTAKLSKWTVALLPETAVLQQHLGHDAQVNDVVSELKELLSRRCGNMKPPIEYEGGATATAAGAPRAIL